MKSSRTNPGFSGKALCFPPSFFGLFGIATERHSECRVDGVGFRVQGSEFRVQGLGFRV